MHYDFEPDNVFYDEEKDAVSVIDFDDSMYNWYAVDLVQALDDMENEIFEKAEDEGASEDEANARFETAKAAFIAGYSSLRPYTDEMRDNMQLFIRFTNIFGYTRITHCITDVVENQPDWMGDLREMLRGVLDKKETFMRG